VQVTVVRDLMSGINDRFDDVRVSNGGVAGHKEG
jgi:hypothetical protein